MNSIVLDASLFIRYFFFFSTIPSLYCIRLICLCIHESETFHLSLRFPHNSNADNKDRRIQQHSMFHHMSDCYLKRVWYRFDFKCRALKVSSFQNWIRFWVFYAECTGRNHAIDQMHNRCIYCFGNRMIKMKTKESSHKSKNPKREMKTIKTLRQTELMKKNRNNKHLSEERKKRTWCIMLWPATIWCAIFYYIMAFDACVWENEYVYQVSLV